MSSHRPLSYPRHFRQLGHSSHPREVTPGFGRVPAKRVRYGLRDQVAVMVFSAIVSLGIAFAVSLVLAGIDWMSAS